MRRVLFSTISSLALAAAVGTAMAADIPRPMPTKAAPVYVPFNWTGLYLGLNGGYGWGRSSFDGVPSTGSFDVDGWLFGITAGYNWQPVGSAWVVGLEGDINWTNIRGSAVCGTAICDTRNRWLGTVRGRVGVAVDRFLPYFTGGLAFGDIQANATGAPGASATKAGWTIGGGVEWNVAGPWSAKVEYLYVDLGKFDCGISCGGTAPDNVSFRTSIIRAGVNYRF